MPRELKGMSLTVGHNQIVPQTCGVGVLGIFRDTPGLLDTDTRRLLNIQPTGGAGWAIASFTDDPMHGEAYAKAERMLKKRFKVVFESEKRTNKRTGRLFWFCIYDTTQDGEKPKKRI